MRLHRLPLIVLAVALTPALLGGCTKDPAPRNSSAPVEQSANPEPTESPSEEPPPPVEPSVAPSPTQAAPPAKKPVKAKPKRAAGPLPQGAPVVNRKPKPNPGPPQCSTKVGTDAPKAAVGRALETAAKRQYWTSTKGVVVPVDLMKAIAWQESGWQSAIRACDGGIGTMQLMKDTVDFLNLKFVDEYHPETLEGNTSLGAEYLAYLIKYFGDNYYADAANRYDLVNNVGMLDAVISAYNMGNSKIDPQDPKTIKNWQYVYNVKALRKNCVCLKY